MSGDQREVQRQDRIRKKTLKCVNFNGSMNQVCDAGVDYTVQAGGDPALRKLPCLLDTQDPERAVQCEHARYPTREEAAASIDEGDRHIREYMAKIGAGECPNCGSGEWSQVGRCVYCDSCHNRLYQGTLPKGKRKPAAPVAQDRRLW